MPLKFSRRMLGLMHPPLIPVSSFSVTLVVSLNLAEPQLSPRQNRDNPCLTSACVKNA